MKKILLALLLLSNLLGSAQNEEKGTFFAANAQLTFALNENYVLFEPDDGENMLDFSAIFIRTAVGHRFNKNIEASINFGLDFHTRLKKQAIPSYVNLQYNIVHGDAFVFFANGSYGNLWSPSSNFEKGKYHGFGLGLQGNDDAPFNMVIRLDFHRKRISDFKDGNLDSVSLGIGFCLF